MARSRFKHFICWIPVGIGNLLQMFRDDVTGKWSLSRISGAVVLALNLMFAAWVVFTTSKFPDLPEGWLMLILGLYGINKIAGVLSTVKKVEE